MAIFARGQVITSSAKGDDWMATKVFISWSGDLSRKLGEALREWLPAALQYVRPYFTPEDIEKGTKWNTEITKELESSNVGIICLTPDNTEKPWILFEAGALSKSIDSARVCTLLFNIDSAEVKGPLTGFQATRFVADDFKRLIVTINNTAGDAKLEPGVLDDVFDMWWPRLEERVKQVIGSHDKKSEKDRRTDRDILEEILELARLNSTKGNRMARSRTEINQESFFIFLHQMREAIAQLAADNKGHHVARLFSILKSYSDEAGYPEIFDQLFSLPPGMTWHDGLQTTLDRFVELDTQSARGSGFGHREIKP